MPRPPVPAPSTAPSSPPGWPSTRAPGPGSTRPSASTPSDLPDGIDRSWYVRPTLFAGVDNGMGIAREEIFGPELSVIRYRDEDDAVRIANDSDELGREGLDEFLDTEAISVAPAP